MELMVHNELEEEFLRFSEWFSYCFTKDIKKRRFKEYNYAFKQCSMGEKVKYLNEWRNFLNKNSIALNRGYSDAITNQLKGRCNHDN